MALSHLNICSLYEVRPNYLVMELMEGAAPVAAPDFSRKLLDLGANGRWAVAAI